MNDKFRKIKNKIDKKKHRQEIAAILGLVESKLAEIKIEQEKNHSGTLEEIQKLLEGVRALIERRDQGFRDLTAYLDYNKELAEKKAGENSIIYLDFVEALQNLTRRLSANQKVSITNAARLKLTKAEMREAFAEALEKLQDIVINQNVIPGQVDYIRKNGLLEKIIEFYDDFKLITEFTRGRDGKVVSHRTTKE